jgi:hypothetical protein
MDAGEEEEGAVAIRTTQPGQIADIARPRLGKIRGRRVTLVGAAILEHPAASIVLSKPRTGSLWSTSRTTGESRGPQITMRLSQFRSSSPPRGMYSAAASSCRSRARSVSRLKPAKSSWATTGRPLAASVLIPTRIRDNCQVAISFATRTTDGAVAALGEEIRQHPEVSPVQLNDPAYVGVAVTSLPGRPGFGRVRTPLVDRHQLAAIIRASTGLREDPAMLLADQTPELRAVPWLPAPGDVA